MLPGASFKLFRIYGIWIEINISWFIVFLLVSYTLATFVFPQQFPNLSPATHIIMGLTTSALFFISILLHELAHSLVAIRNGLPIQAITLFIFGGVSQMTQEPATPGVEFKVAIAGPISSIILGIFFAAIAAAAGLLGGIEEILGPAIWLAFINISLAVFNMIPGFPLDGGRVFRAVLWRFTGSLMRATVIASRGGQVVAFLLALGGFAFFVSGNFANGVWLVLIAWFLEQAAVSGAEGAKLQASLSRYSVAEIMTAPADTVSPDMTITELVDDHFNRYRHGRFPVTAGETLLGIVTIDDLRGVQRRKWDETTVRDIMQPVTEEMQIAPDATAFIAMKQMAETDLGHLLVLADGGVRGIVTRGDLMRLLRRQEKEKEPVT